MRPFEHAALECPGCHERLDASRNLTGAKAPAPGDFTVCVYCRTILVFGTTGLCVASERDFEQVSSEQRARLRRIQEAIREARRDYQ